MNIPVQLFSCKKEVLTLIEWFAFFEETFIDNLKIAAVVYRPPNLDPRLFNSAVRGLFELKTLLRECNYTSYPP